MLHGLKKFLKKIKFVRKLYYRLRMNVSIPEVICITPRQSENSREMRLNILVPSIQTNHTFGGVSTALSFFERMADELGVKRRIVCIDVSVSEKDMANFPGYCHVRWNDDLSAERQVLCVSKNADETFPVWEGDIFITTAWWTEYNLLPVLKWQSAVYDRPILNHIYLIQDYEPGFYPWSTHYMLAESTYRSEPPAIAVFNSRLLKDYFANNGYRFEHAFYFDPVMNPKLSVHISKEESIKKEKKILVYGRPSVSRNAFEMIVEALKLWVLTMEGSHEWSLVSVGEEHRNVDLGNGCVLKSMGKLSLKEYADTMKAAHAGISLMVSPHSSYPPLEMSTFGVKTITNSYANKDLSNFNRNIISLKDCTAQTICKELKAVCSCYTGDGSYCINEKYINPKVDEIGEIIKQIKAIGLC